MKTIESITLQYSDVSVGGSSHKEYSCQLIQNGEGYLVNFQYGRIGSTMTPGTKTPQPVSREEAFNIYDRLLSEKASKGYLSQVETKDAPVRTSTNGNGNELRTPYPIEPLKEITIEEAEKLLEDDRYLLQVKADFNFCQIQKFADGTYQRFNKLGKAVDSIPAEVLYDLKKIVAKTFFIEGEIGGNWLITYNLLEFNGRDLRDVPYGDRFSTLEGLVVTQKLRYVTTIATWKGSKKKKVGWASLKSNRCEGGVFKLISARYSVRGRQHYKGKFVKSLSAIVTALGHKGRNNATLGLIDDGKIIEVGRCSLNGKPDVKVGNIVEVLYLYCTEGKRLYQPRLDPNKPVRDDVDRQQCTVKQLIFKQGVNNG